MNEVTQSIEMECERRLTNLHNESHNWLLQSAQRVTKNREEAEDLVSELYQYLHIKKNIKLWWGENSYNLLYCSKFLKCRYINKTKKLNRTTYVEDIWDTELDIPYDEEQDTAMQRAYDDVMNELKRLETTKMWPSAKIFSIYWMSDDTLDGVAKKIGISKSTTFLAVRKIRKYLEQVIDNPFNGEK
jgi:DNA-directed RNA polymerase specialized sigma24 family protein